jgi:hypothetical protein
MTGSAGRKKKTREKHEKNTNEWREKIQVEKLDETPNYISAQPIQFLTEIASKGKTNEK